MAHSINCIKDKRIGGDLISLNCLRRRVSMTGYCFSKAPNFNYDELT